MSGGMYNVDEWTDPDRDPAPMTREELAAAMADSDVLVPTVTDRIDATLLGQAGAGLKLIANYGAGVDHIDVDAAWSRGIQVSNTPGVVTDDTADMAMALILAVTRRIPEGLAEMQAGRWQGWAPTAYLGRRIAGARLGILGMGRIGQAVARRAASWPRPGPHTQTSRLPSCNSSVSGASVTITPGSPARYTSPRAVAAMDTRPAPPRRAAPDVAGERVGQRAVARRERRGVGLGAAVKRLPHPLDLLANPHVADADLAQIEVHVGEHRVEHRLRELRPRLRRALQPIDQQEHVHPDQVEPAVHRVRHAEAVVEQRVPGGADGRRVKLEPRPLMTPAPQQTEECHWLTSTPAPPGRHGIVDTARRA